ncbi:MAG: hypothetical protein LUH23_09290 [Oscillospiraceae bacterium]|nr:hypothetical protein [Oscillospiraceae bacterium]
MGSLDDAIRDYFGQPEVIAELFNRFVLNVELNPSEMTPVDVIPIFNKLKDYGSKLTLEKFQHIYRKLFLMKIEKLYCALLVETEISDASPIKLCLFENGLYATEIETWDCINNGGLLPCYTVALYLSPEHCHLRETANESPYDYSFYMIEPAEISDGTIAELSKDLGGILYFVKISDDVRKRQEFLSSEAYARMGDSVKKLIHCFSDCMITQ